MTSNRSVHWSSRFAFLMAAMGSAVGLANIWRFPYTAGVSGGGAFVFIYIGAVLLLALPVLIAELMIGRRGAAPPPRAIATVAKESGRSAHWGLVGVILGRNRRYPDPVFLCCGWWLDPFLRLEDGFRRDAGHICGCGSRDLWRPERQPCKTFNLVHHLYCRHRHCFSARH